MIIHWWKAVTMTLLRALFGIIDLAFFLARVDSTKWALLVVLLCLVAYTVRCWRVVMRAVEEELAP